MSASLRSTEHPWNQTYSEIIDVRSPAEFAEDHIPTAINLPVLDNQQRAQVGTLYKQVSPFTARKVGAALVTQNISHFLATHFAAKPKDYQPLIYCWRGGQRSNSLAIVLSQIGWPVTLLQGGYKTYRAYVRQQLEQLPQQLTFRVLSGMTGTGKTYILRKLAQHQAQILDLEQLANHRGSLLGAAWQSPQPSQKYFESLLHQSLLKLTPDRPVWVEAESHKIGQRYLPRSLWQRIIQAPRWDIQLPLEARVQGLLAEYSHLINHPEILKAQLAHLKARHGHKKLNQWLSLIDTQQWQELVKDLLETHYDPAYTHSIQGHYPQPQQVLSLPDLTETTLAQLLDTQLLENREGMALT